MEKKTPDVLLMEILKRHAFVEDGTPFYEAFTLLSEREKVLSAFALAKEYATQETKPLQERIDELEGALKSAKTEIDYKKSYEDLLYQVKANITYLTEKAAEYDATNHDDEAIKATFTGKAFAYRWSAHKLVKSLEWLGII